MERFYHQVDLGLMSRTHGCRSRRRHF